MEVVNDPQDFLSKLKLKNIYTVNTSLRNSCVRYVANKLPWQFQKFSVCLGNKSARKTAKNLAETFVLSQEWLWHTLAFC